jgi:[methyl-Co(III) methanol-specific corrinoid protein]:coenzyme M methyltransferase
VACRNPNLAAELAATGHTELGFDSVMPYFSIVQESSALGCEVQWETKDNWPTVSMTRPLWCGSDDVNLPPGFLEHPDSSVVPRSIEILRREFHDEVAIVGKVVGLGTLAYQLFGVERLLMMTVDEPDMAARCLDRLKDPAYLRRHHRSYGLCGYERCRYVPF